MWSCTPRRLRSAHNSTTRVFSRARALRTTSLLSLRLSILRRSTDTQSLRALPHSVTTPLNRRLLRDVWSAVHAASCRVACPDLSWPPPRFASSRTFAANCVLQLRHSSNLLHSRPVR
uniref:(northern house mosquito) hypothetical protein n=1 Tax=Culex pipiens TaxID=7175 RepID=A0A8D8GDT9_CULPI